MAVSYPQNARAVLARPRPAAAPGANEAQSQQDHGRGAAQQAGRHWLTLPNRCAHSLWESVELLLALGGAATRLGRPGLGDACAGNS